MNRPLFLRIIPWAVIILFCMQPAQGWGGEVVVVQSAGLAPYNEALRGFAHTLTKDVPTSGPKSIQAHTTTSYILSEVESPVQLRQTLSRQRPDLLLAIGSSSLSLVKDLADIPILYLMVPYPELVIESQDNITGINMTIPPSRQLEALVRVMPQTGTVGLLYDPERTGALVQEAHQYAAQQNISLLALPVENSSEVPSRLARLSGRADWLWMLPDRTVLTPQTIDHIFLFSLENRIPILTFSDKYLDMGAVLSVSLDFFDMGKQAGEMALKVMGSSGIADIPPQPARNVIVNTNKKAAQMLGIVLENQDGPE
ncbi:MAG: hypothetical protein M8357_09080 [Desulfobulbaceae bacterium]|nr:hypothetical protein [Desulfobulbaceae bacterium]